MVKNIIISLSIILLLALAYYLFFMGEDTNLEFASSEVISAQLLQETQLFFDRQRIMQQIGLNTEIFNNPPFRNLASFELEIPSVQIGKEQLFDTLVPVSSQATTTGQPPSTTDIINRSSS